MAGRAAARSATGSACRRGRARLRSRPGNDVAVRIEDGEGVAVLEHADAESVGRSASREDGELLDRSSSDPGITVDAIRRRIAVRLRPCRSGRVRRAAAR